MNQTITPETITPETITPETPETITPETITPETPETITPDNELDRVHAVDAPETPETITPETPETITPETITPETPDNELDRVHAVDAPTADELAGLRRSLANKADRETIVSVWRESVKVGDLDADSGLTMAEYRSRSERADRIVADLRAFFAANPVDRNAAKIDNLRSGLDASLRAINSLRMQVIYDLESSMRALDLPESDVWQMLKDVGESVARGLAPISRADEIAKLASIARGKAARTFTADGSPRAPRSAESAVVPMDRKHLAYVADGDYAIKRDGVTATFALASGAFVDGDGAPIDKLNAAYSLALGVPAGESSGRNVWKHGKFTSGVHTGKTLDDAIIAQESAMIAAQAAYAAIAG